MKNKIILFLIVLFASCSSSSSLHYVQNSQVISERKFDKKWHNDELGLLRWMYRDKGKIISTLHEFVYEPYTISYHLLQKNVEKITGRKFSNNTIFLLEYTYLNDLCSQFSTNNWDKEKII